MNPERLTKVIGTREALDRAKRDHARAVDEASEPVDERRFRIIREGLGKADIERKLGESHDALYGLAANLWGALERQGETKYCRRLSVKGFPEIDIYRTPVEGYPEEGVKLADGSIAPRFMFRKVGSTVTGEEITIFRNIDSMRAISPIPGDKPVNKQEERLLAEYEDDLDTMSRFYTGLDMEIPEELISAMPVDFPANYPRREE